MLEKDIEKRFTLQQIRRHAWTTSRPQKTLECVPIPPLRGDEWHTMTVLPYLMESHYGNDSNSTYYTERELNGKKCSSFILLCFHNKLFIIQELGC